MTIALVYLPKLGMAMEEGTIVEWLVADGEPVQKGRPLYVVDNEKVETEIESPCSGTVRILVAPGATCAVGTPIAEIDAPDV
jgi:pyruvate dehydrogenase E2 component (dihydrolipoamide acetyltransferase)